MPFAAQIPLYSRGVGTYDGAAMDTHPDERLPYLELARQEARVVRELPASELRRLTELAPGVGTLSVDMVFSKDDTGRPWVQGTLTSILRPTCQRCLAAGDWPVRLTFRLCIVRDGTVASELAEQADVLGAESESVSIADVIEDELLLAVPERLCSEEPCPNAPALSFPAGEAPVDEARDNPFDVLSQLKR